MAVATMTVSNKRTNTTSYSAVRASVAWALAALFYFYEIMLLVSPSVMTVQLEQDFNASKTQLGQLAGFYFYAYAGMQIPVGLLMDRYGPRILITIASLLCAFGCVLMSMATEMWVLYIARLIMGIGGAFAVVGCLKLASLLFPLNRFALLTGIMVAVGMMGAVMGQMPVAKCVEVYGWRETLLGGASLGMLFSLVAWCLIRHPSPCQQLKSKSQAFRDKLSVIFKDLLTVMSNPQVWLAAIYAGLMYVPTTAFGEFWGIRYLISKYNIDEVGSSPIMAMIFFGWAFGGPCFGWISDHVGRRKSPMAVAVVGTIAMMLAVMYLPLTKIQMQLCLFFLGVFSSGFILAYSVVRELNSPALTGTAVGFINTLNNASGFMAPVIGFAIDQQITSIDAGGERIIPIEIFNNALLVIPAGLIVAFVILPFIKETFCRPAMLKR